MPINSSGYLDNSVLYLTSIASGAGITQRIGNQIKVTSVDWGIKAVNQSATTARYVRLMLVKYKTWAAGTSFPGSSTLQVVGTGGLAYLTSTITPYNWENRDSFRVMYDKTVLLYPNNGTPDGEKYQTTFKKHLKMGVKVTYNGSSGAVSNCQNNGLFLVMITDVASGVLADGWVRVKFRDA